MLLLYETAAGYALFKVNDGKITDVAQLWDEFSSPEQKIVSLQKFAKFENIAEAMSASSALVEGKMAAELKTFLKKNVVKKGLSDKLAIADPKLAVKIKEKLGIKCVFDNTVSELLRCVRMHQEELLRAQVGDGNLGTMALGLGHSMSRYKLKFSPDKIDTMVVQAVSLLDDLDKELNTYSMRAREWYGYHFPDLAKIIPDNLIYCKVVQRLGFRTNAATAELDELLPEEMVAAVRQASHISMGTEISELDMEHISDLCAQVVEITEYRESLVEYLRNRMQAIAPNLTALLGEVIGARLIARAGTLVNLAKFPASTVQILGAEKALFRALKSKHDTPKYGLIYHASLIGQAQPKNKGRVSRLLAAKASLSARVDALGDKDTPEVGAANRAKVEARIRQLEGRAVTGISGAARTIARAEKYDAAAAKAAAPGAYNAAADMTFVRSGDDDDDVDAGDRHKKRKHHTDAEAPVSFVRETPAAVEPPKKDKKSSDKKEKKSSDKKEKKSSDKKEKKSKKEDKKKRKHAD